MKFRRLNPNVMPWYYYVAIVFILLLITYIGLYFAGEVGSPLEFLLNLKNRYL